jgi:TPR repeat protein
MRHPSLLAIPFLIFVLLATAAAQQDTSPAPGKYQDAATHGDTQAMTEIGRAYETGRGGAKDRQKAREWYEKAAGLGNKTAMFRLGEMIQDDGKTARHIAQASQWYEKAAALGSADAMNALGEIYERGPGVPHDFGRARHWYERAARRGNAAAMNNLGGLYEDGKGVDKDHQCARGWFEKSARSHNAFAMDNLGSMYLNAQGTARDLVQAKQWFEKAAGLGNASAMNNLGYMYGFVRGAEHNGPLALTWLQRAVAVTASRAQNRGRADAMTDLGAMYFEGVEGVARDYVQSRRWLERATALGSVDAMVILGYLYQCAAGVPRDMQKAMQLYEKAAAQGNRSGMAHLAFNYTGVIGIEKDYKKAVEWYEKAAALGDVTVMYNLGNIYDEGPNELRDYPKAVTWYEKAAAQADDETLNNWGAPMATYRLGYLNEHGLGVAKDEAKAREWYLKSASLDHAGAMSALSKMYADGRGGAKDDALARQWREKAAALYAKNAPKPPPPPKYPPCKAADLDETFASVDGPDNDYLLAMTFHNTSSRTCTLDKVAAAPSFVTNMPDAKVKSCYFCGDANVRTGTELVLAPGAAAHQTYRWKIVTADGSSPCLVPGWLQGGINQENQGILLTARPFLKPICSPVVTSSYALGKFKTDKPKAVAAPPLPTIQWLPEKSTYYQHESVTLRAVINDPGNLLVLDEHSCPEFVRSLYWPQGGVRVDDVWGKRCKVDTSVPLASGKRIAVTLDAGHQSEWDAAMGDYTLDVAVVANVDAEHVMVHSPSLHLTVADAAKIPRKWGPQVKGIAVDLTMDRDTYEVGQDIPLHFAMENFSATEPVLGPNPIWDPGYEVAVEVRDSCGLKIPSSGGAIWMGHGFPPIHYQPGAPIAIERTLSQMGFLPDRPGAYTIVAIWAPFTCPDKQQDIDTATGKCSTYATAQSSLSTFRVTDTDHPETAATKFRCLARPPSFQEVDTAFGPKTALQDNLTGLKWLHLRLTEGLGWTRVKQEFVVGGRFQGWRDATKEELQQFFVHYVGSPDGQSADPALAARLIDDLGGPLYVWMDQTTRVRHESASGMLDEAFGLGRAIYGSIQFSDPATGDAKIDPNLIGSATDGVAYVASFLVQDENTATHAQEKTKPPY